MLNTLASAIVLYRSVCDRREDVSRSQFEQVVSVAHEAAITVYPALALAPSAHVFQKTRVIEAASLMLERATA